jgi:hypothetical protein
MLTLEEKKGLILKAEERFALQVAAATIERPETSLWMILIPILFIFHLFQLRQNNSGRKVFAQGFMASPKRALDAVAIAVQTKTRPDIETIAQKASIPSEIKGEYSRWLTVLAGHYMDLLCAEGSSFAALLRAVYQNRDNYLLFLDRLGEFERGFMAVLKPHLSKTTPDVDTVVVAMEHHCMEIRRATATQIFP